MRAYGKQIEEAVAASPEVLAPLRLHYLRWQLFDVGSGLHFQYQGIFDTDFDKYTEDAVQLFSATGVTAVFTNLEGFPQDWKENPQAFIEFVRAHQVPSFLEYGEYPYVTAGHRRAGHHGRVRPLGHAGVHLDGAAGTRRRRGVAGHLPRCVPGRYGAARRDPG